MQKHEKVLTSVSFVQNHEIYLDLLDPSHNYQGVTYLHMACLNHNLLKMVKLMLKGVNKNNYQW